MSSKKDHLQGVSDTIVRIANLLTTEGNPKDISIHPDTVACCIRLISDMANRVPQFFSPHVVKITTWGEVQLTWIVEKNFLSLLIISNDHEFYTTITQALDGREEQTKLRTYSIDTIESYFNTMMKEFHVC